MVESKILKKGRAYGLRGRMASKAKSLKTRVGRALRSKRLG